MAKEIIAVIGSRKAGKSLAVDIIAKLCPEMNVVSCVTPVIKDFIALQDMTIGEFRHPFPAGPDFEQHMKMVFLLKEANQEKYLHYLINELEHTEYAVVDDIYTFKELDLLIKLNARLLLIESKQDKRKEFGYISGMDREFYTQEVATINANIVKNWKRTTVIPNNSNIATLKLLLGSTL